MSERSDTETLKSLVEIQHQTIVKQHQVIKMLEAEIEKLRGEKSGEE